jgi:hypothetical protein
MSKDIIDMAREAGICTWLKPPEDVTERLERFAELVRADEREACAKVCDDIDVEYEGEDVLATWCAAAIRARGNT